MPAPVSNIEKNIKNKKEAYACSKCSSNIEIISIDDKESKITFNCLNEKHGRQEMDIYEYLKNMERNTYYYDKCSICEKEQGDILPIFKCCIKCNVIICKDCESSHLKNKNTEHFLINNNEKSIKCLYHPNYNNFVYCFDCKKHFCIECLRPQTHIYHKRILISSESSPSEEDKDIHSKIINILNKNKIELEQELILDDISGSKLLDNYNRELNSINDNLEKELSLNKEKLKKELENLKNVFLILIKKTKNKYSKLSEEINSKYNELKEKCKISYLNNLNLMTKLKNINNLIIINEIIKNTQEKYCDNYFNNKNVINTLTSFSKSQNNEIREIFKNTKYYNNTLNETPFKKEKLDESILSSSYLRNDILSKKIKREENNLIDDENRKKKKINIENDNKIYEKEKDISKNNDYSQKKNIYDIDDEENRTKIGNNDEEKEKTKIFEIEINKEKIKCKNNEKEKEEINEKEKENKNVEDKILNATSNNIIKDAYCSTDIINSFIVFNSLNNNSYIIYSNWNEENGNKNYSIISYNLSEDKTEKIYNNAHSTYISYFQYIHDKNKKKETIMSLSYYDRNVKLWEFNKWECFLNITIYHKGFIYSACIFEKNKSNFLVVSNFILDEDKIKYNIKTGPIKVYNYKNKNYKINRIENSQYDTLLIETYSKDDNIFIITSGKGRIRAYDYSQNVLFNEYKDNNNNFIFCFILFKEKEKTKIIGSCEYSIKIWDFQTSDLINEIKSNGIKMRGISLFNDKYLLVGCLDNSIKLIELDKNIIIHSFNEHTKKVCSIKTINLPKIGKCFLSHGYDDQILLWN